MRQKLAAVCVGMVVGLPLLLTSVSSAQELDYGFRVKAPGQTTGDERASQTNLWILEVQFKTLRQVHVDLPDPKTGELRDEIVLYLVYKVVNRGLGEKKSDADTTPINTFDPEIAPPMFVPELTLVTQDNGPQKIYADMLVPAAEKLIRQREKLPPGAVLKNSVKIQGPIPQETPAGAPQEIAEYGVAMWRGVDPEADRFSIMFAGFSNGYKLVHGPVSYQTLVDQVAAGKLTFSDQIWDGKSDWKAASETYNLFDAKKSPPENPDATIWFYTTTHDRVKPDQEQPIVWRKTLIQRFWRPGDQFDRREKEYRFVGEPVWIYQPDDKRVPVVGNPTGVAAAPAPAKQ